MNPITLLLIIVTYYSRNLQQQHCAALCQQRAHKLRTYTVHPGTQPLNDALSGQIHKFSVSHTHVDLDSRGQRVEMEDVV